MEMGRRARCWNGVAGRLGSEKWKKKNVLVSRMRQWLYKTRCRVVQRDRYFAVQAFIRRENVEGTNTLGPSFDGSRCVNNINSAPRLSKASKPVSDVQLLRNSDMVFLVRFDEENLQCRGSEEAVAEDLVCCQIRGSWAFAAEA